MEEWSKVCIIYKETVYFSRSEGVCNVGAASITLRSSCF